MNKSNSKKQLYSVTKESLKLCSASANNHLHSSSTDFSKCSVLKNVKLKFSSKYQSNMKFQAFDTYLPGTQKVNSEEVLYRKDGYLITRKTLSVQHYYPYSVGDVANKVLSLKVIAFKI